MMERRVEGAEDSEAEKNSKEDKVEEGSMDETETPLDAEKGLPKGLCITCPLRFCP